MFAREALRKVGLTDEIIKKLESIEAQSELGQVPLLAIQPPKKTSQMGLREGWTRVTFILREEHVEKLKSLAYWERATIKDIMDEALSMYLENTKKKIIK